MIKLVIEGTTTAELATAIAALHVKFANEGTAPVEQTKPATRTRKTADKTDEQKSEEAPNATTLDASSGTDQSSDQAGTQASASTTSETGPTAQTDASPSDGPSKDDALKAAMLFGQSNGDDALKAKITAMGATKFSEIPAEKYGDFVASLEAPAASILD